MIGKQVALLGEPFRFVGRNDVNLPRNDTLMHRAPQFHSAERRNQLQAISDDAAATWADTGHTLGAKDVKKGSSEWWAILLKAPKGTGIGLSINAGVAAKSRDQGVSVCTALEVIPCN